MPKFYIGTSGYSYPHWRKLFYPQGIDLSYYSRFFNSVEINATFYRLPKKEVFADWYKKTPPGFKFILKGPRLITHIRRLKNIEAELKAFLKHAAFLQDKFFGILWQLPPNLKYEPKVFSRFVKNIAQKSIKIRQALEVRNKTWLNPQVYSLLCANNLALCFADSSRYESPGVITADFIYLRFHGQKSLYSSNYSYYQLRKYKDKVKKWEKKIETFLIFFNNDAQAFAVKNALSLKRMLSK